MTGTNSQTSSTRKLLVSSCNFLSNQNHRICRYLLHYYLINAGKVQTYNSSSSLMQSMHMCPGKIKLFRLPNANAESVKFQKFQMLTQLLLMFGLPQKLFKSCLISRKLVAIQRFVRSLTSRFNCVLTIFFSH